MSRPLVSLRSPLMARCSADDLVEIPELVVLDCSECGQLSELEERNYPTVARLSHEAHQHAQDQHAGDVDAEGWIR